jgi:WD40 repeat protein
VASASDDQTVRLWDAASGQLRSTLVGHRDKVVAAEFTPDGKHLVSCAREGGLFFWDLAQLPQYESYRVQNGNIQSLSIAPGGAVVAIGGHSTVVWSMADRRDLARPPGHLGQVNGVAFSHDGKHLAGAGEEGLVRVWDTRNWQLEATLVGHRGPAFSVAFSPDDRTLASVDIHGIVHIWDVRSGARDTIASGQGRIWCVSFSPDGRTLATVSRDSTVKLWDLARDRACVKIAISAASMPSLAFSRDSNNLTVVNEKGQLWKFEGTSGRLIESRRYDRAGPVQRVALSKEASLLVTVAEVGPSTLWDLENDRRASGLPVTEPSSMGIAIAPEGRSIALQLGYLEKALVWHSSRAAQTTIDGINGSYDFSPSGEFLTTFGRAIHEPQLWEVATGRVHRTSAVGHRSSIDAEAFSPDGKSLATGSGDGTIIVWAVPELERRHQLPNVNAAVGSLGFSPDGRTLVAGYQDHLVRLWDYESGTELATLEGHSGGVVRATFSPDGLMLATCAEVHGGGFEVFLWRATAPR